MMVQHLGACDFLILPCRENAGPDHWQSHWQQAFPDMIRVEQDDWVRPRREAWMRRLDEYVARATKPVVLVAHSLGTSLIMHWAGQGDISRIAGAFMVAPSDRGPADIWSDAGQSGFAPMILDRFHFPSMVLASRNDPYVSFDRAAHFADCWGARLVDMGRSGHMGNSERLGLWPAGLVHLGMLLGSLGPTK